MEKREVVGCVSVVSVVLAASFVNISEDDGGTMTCDNPTLAEKYIFIFERESLPFETTYA